ncbi:MAG: hypothetical protein Q8M37_06905, partial [Nevskia sp.]|nr:hypothetical protein [Nevskia sp.]
RLMRAQPSNAPIPTFPRLRGKETSGEPDYVALQPLDWQRTAAANRRAAPRCRRSIDNRA